MKEIKVVKKNPCDDCGIKGLYDNCKDECVQYRKYYQYQQGRADQLKETQKQFELLYADKMEQVRADERERIINELKSEIDKYQKYNYPEDDYESGFESGCEFAFRKAVMIV